MFCARCGTAVTTPAAFCSNCGAPLPAAQAPAAQAPAAPAAGAAPPFATPAAAPAYATTGAAPFPGAVAVPGMLEYAGFWRRFWACCLDSIILSVLMIPIRLIVALPVMTNAFNEDMTPESIASAFAAGAAGLFFGVLLAWIYYAFMESSAKQATLGKIALGIQVTSLDGRRISFARATGRYFAHMITALTLLIGYLIQPFTARRQALHDLIAGTLVLRTPNR
jgi:uncharacterized RDD family membrane protein YckC